MVKENSIHVPRSGGVMRDPDEINQKLWARKKLKIRRAKNEDKKMRKGYFNIKDSGAITGDV